jgi:hypothetical protein
VDKAGHPCRPSALPTDAVSPTSFDHRSQTRWHSVDLALAFRSGVRALAMMSESHVRKVIDPAAILWFIHRSLGAAPSDSGVPRARWRGPPPRLTRPWRSRTAWIVLLAGTRTSLTPEEELADLACPPSTASQPSAGQSVARSAAAAGWRSAPAGATDRSGPKARVWAVRARPSAYWLVIPPSSTRGDQRPSPACHQGHAPQMRRRAAVEPVIGHLKDDPRIRREPLHSA